MADDIRKIKPVRDYLLDIAIYDQFDLLAEKYGIEKERTGEFLDLTDAVIKNQATLDTMPTLLSKAFNLDDAQSKALAADIAGYRLLPLENYLPGVAQQIIAWGGNIDDYPKLRVKFEKVEEKKNDIESFLYDLAAKIKLELPENLLKRFVFLSKGYLTGERNREITRLIMKRDLNLGGLELTDQQANNLLNLLDKEKPKAEPVSGPLLTSPLKGEEAPTPAVEKPVVVETPVIVEKIVEAPAAPRRKVGKQILPEPMLTEETNASAVSRRQVGTPILPEKQLPKAAIVSQPILKKEKPSKLVKAAKPVAMKFDEQTKAIAGILKPVFKAFEKKNIAHRTYHVSVGAFVRGQEGYEELMGTFADYNFSSAEIENLLPLIEKARVALLGKPLPLKPATLPQKATTHALAKEVPIISGSILAEDETKEVEAAAKRIKQGAKPVIMSEAVIEALSNAYEVMKVKRVAKKDFNKIAETYLRGVRELIPTEQLLQEKYKLDDNQLDRVSKALVSAQKLTQQGSGKAGIVPVTDVKDTETELVTQEKKILDERHAVITKSLSKTEVEPIAAMAQVSAARTKEEEQSIQMAKIDPEKLEAAQSASRPEPVTTRLSVASAPPEPEAKVTDVKYARTTVGPVEMLRMMRPAEFRRLSSDPTQAVLKIEDQLALLESTAYEERIKGIEAWRESPINQLHLTMTKESLKDGVSIAEIATKRRNAGEESLSPAEISAIVALNNRIKF